MRNVYGWIKEIVERKIGSIVAKQIKTNSNLRQAIKNLPSRKVGGR